MDNYIKIFSNFINDELNNLPTVNSQNHNSLVLCFTCQEIPKIDIGKFITYIISKNIFKDEMLLI